MLAYRSLISLAALQSVSAHFGLVFPEWRGDTLSEENEKLGYDQWVYPCANVKYGEGNITEWPLEGGALALDLHHDWTYVFVNLGLGKNTSNFNISLTPEFWNATNPGVLRVEQLELPFEPKEGDLASLQVVTVGDTGSALYNCADIRFSSNASTPSNTTNEVEYFPIQEQDGEDNSTSNGNSSDTESQGNEEDDSAAGIVGVNKIALSSVVGLAAAFVMGIGF